VQTKKLPIIRAAVLLPGGTSGCFNPKTNVLLYDKRLNKYPRLKQFVLRHEISHWKDYPSYSRILKRELVDYYRLRFDKRYRRQSAIYNIEIRKEGEPDSRRELWKAVFFGWILGVYVLILSVPQSFYNLYVEIKSERRRKA
jgi:hypothetical protein